MSRWHAGALLLVVGAACDRPAVDAALAPASAAQAFLPHQLPAGVTLVHEENGVIVPRSRQFRSEVSFQPALAELRDTEQLDVLVDTNGGDEWSRMVRLARWVHDQWAPSRPNPYPPWDARSILASIRSSETGGFCAQYAVVLVQTLLALGGQARYLELEAEPEAGGHLGVEVWSNEHDKWAVLDPFFGVFVEQRDLPGTPLSALEIHRARAAGRAQDLVLRSIGGDEDRHPPPAADLLAYFAHLAIDMRNDHLSHPLGAWNRSETYLAWVDDQTTGRPDVFTQHTDEPLDFDFPMNQVQVTLQATGATSGQLACGLRTNMPEAVAIEVRLDDGPPLLLDVAGALDPFDGELDTTLVPNPTFGLLLSWTWQLHEGSNRARFRAIGPTGVAGPATQLEVVRAAGD